MSDNFEKIIKNISKNISLSKEEKELIKGRLEKFMADHPVSAGLTRRLNYQRSFSLTDIFKLKLKNMPIVAIIAILALLGGGTTFAAERSLPGDVLYSLKTRVIEPAQETFTFSASEKAQLEAQLAELRLQEAEKLAAQGKLTSSLQAEVDANFSSHANKAQSLVKELEAQNNISDAVGVSSELESSLRAHGRILSLLGVSTTADKAEMEARDSQDARVESEDMIVNATSSAEFQAAANEKLSEVQNKIAEVQSFIQLKSGSVSTSTLAQSQAQVSAANSLVVQGQAKLTAGDFKGAFLLFQQAQRTAQSAKVMLAASDEFKLNLRAGDFDIENRSNVQFNSTSSQTENEGDHGTRGQRTENQTSSQNEDNGGGENGLRVRSGVNATSSENNTGVKINVEL